MHVVVAPDKFKGSLTAREVADRVAAGIAARSDPGGRRRARCRSPTAATAPWTPRSRPATSGSRCARTGPTGEPVDTAYAVRDGVAVVEMADVSGLRLLPPDRLAPLTATSYGTGEVVRAALDRGCRSVVLGIGGSASTDGGAGMLEALGVRLLDAAGNRAAARRRRAGRPRPRRPVRAAPAAGRRRGSSSPATSTTRCSARTAPPRCTGRRRARARTTSRARRRAGALGRRASTPRPARADVRDRAGAGAAGGVGYAAMAVLGAELEPGIELVLDLVRFADHLPGASLVITGEGSLDEQTLHGKAPAGVAAAAAKAGIPVVDGLGPARPGPARSCGRPGSPPPTPSPTSNPTCSAAWPRPARCWNAWPRTLARERIGGTTP